MSLWVEKVVFSFHYELSNWSGKPSKALIDLQGWFLLLPTENYISLTTFGRSKHKTLKKQYIYVENYIYKKLKEAVEIYNIQTKNHSVLAKIYKVYILFTPKCYAFANSSFPLLSIMKCYKPNRWRMFYFHYPPLHSMRIIFESFGNLVNVLHDYQLIQVGSSS